MIIRIARLVHVMIEHPVEQQPVIHMLAAQHFDPLHRARGEIRPHLDHDAPFAGVDHQRVLRVQLPPGAGGGLADRDSEGEGGESAVRHWRGAP